MLIFVGLAIVIFVGFLPVSFYYENTFLDSYTY